MGEHVYEFMMPMVERIQMRIGRVEDQIRGVRDLMHENRYALADEPDMFRERLGRIQTIFTDMHAQIQQGVGEHERRIEWERELERDRQRRRDLGILGSERVEHRPAAPRRHDHLAAERALVIDAVEDDAPERANDASRRRRRRDDADERPRRDRYGKGRALF